MTTEQVYAASFALLQTLSTSVSPPGPFVTVSRRLKLVEEVGVQQMPAIYQHQLTIRPTVETLMGIAMLSYRCDWYIYASVQNMDIPTTPVLNPLLDAVLAKVPQETTGTTLEVQVDGVTVNLTVDGPIEFFEGLLDTKSVVRIPIHIRAQI